MPPDGERISFLGPDGVDREVQRLVTEIKRLGIKDPATGHYRVKYGVLTHDPTCEQVFEGIVGTLKAAKKRKVVHFEGEMLLSPVHDNVEITLINSQI